jgi:hypothetical protein
MGTVIAVDGAVKATLEQQPGIEALPNHSNELW